MRILLMPLCTMTDFFFTFPCDLRGKQGRQHYGSYAQKACIGRGYQVHHSAGIELGTWMIMLDSHNAHPTHAPPMHAPPKILGLPRETRRVKVLRPPPMSPRCPICPRCPMRPVREKKVVKRVDPGIFKGDLLEIHGPQHHGLLVENDPPLVLYRFTKKTWEPGMITLGSH